MADLSHLSLLDGAFLHLESPEMPMHVGSLALFDPPSPEFGGATDWYEAVKAHVASRMHLAPVFTRKLALMPFDLANPVWIPDDDIDLDYHVRYLVLPQRPAGTDTLSEDQLAELVTRDAMIGVTVLAPTQPAPHAAPTPAT